MQELRMLVGLSPLMIGHINVPFSPIVVASDASELGLGVSSAQVEPSTIATVAVSSTLEIDDQEPVLNLVESIVWKAVISHPWRDSEHISVLEMRALATAARWAANQAPSGPHKILFLCDSAAVIGAASKGRSSAFSFTPPLRRFAAVCLCFLSVPVLRWVPSDYNPADGPSRLILDNG